MAGSGRRRAIAGQRQVRRVRTRLFRSVAMSLKGKDSGYVASIRGLDSEGRESPGPVGPRSGQSGGIIAKRGKIPAVLLPFFSAVPGERAGQLQREKLRATTP